MDCVVAMSNCPQDPNPCNSGTLKPFGWAVSAARSKAQAPSASARAFGLT
jgi:uncharacterized protein YcgI (DUF1989 family)